ncbi:MAG: hypothetical protein ACO2ZM_05310 [Francisellaceae bacterium]
MNYNTLTTTIGIDSDQSTAVDNKLDIQNFSGFYTVPVDLYKKSNTLPYRNIGDYTEYLDGDKHYVVLATLGGGLSVSEDGGQTWKTITVVDGLVSNYVSAAHFDSNGRLYILTDAGLGISDDFTKSWTFYKDDGSSDFPLGSLRPKEGEAQMHKYNMTVKGNDVYIPRVGSNGFMVFHTDSKTVSEYLDGNSAYNIAVDGSNIAVATQNGLFLSRNGGSSWENILARSGSPISSKENTYEVAFGDNTLYFASPFTEEGVMMFNLNNNSFSQYTTANSGLVSHDIGELVYANNKLYVATKQGLSIRDAQGNWHTATTADGLPSNFIYELYVDGDKIVVMMYKSGLAISTDGGSSWGGELFNSNTPAEMRGLDLFVKDDAIYIGSVEGGLSRSLDGGANWTSYLSGNIMAVYAPDYDRIYAGTENKMQYSVDNGATWQSVRFDIPGESYDDNNPEVWDLYPVGDKLYAGAYDAIGVFDLNTNSIDKVISVGSNQENYRVRSVLVNGNTLFAGTENGGLYIDKDMTVDDGNWIHYTNANIGPKCILPENEVYNLAYDAFRDNLYIGYANYDRYNADGLTVLNNPLAGSSGQDSCLTYTMANSDLPNDQVRATFVDDDGLVYVATYGGGVAVFNPDTSRFEKIYTVADGLGSNYVSDVKIDKSTHTLYAYTRGGISKLKLTT